MPIDPSIAMSIKPFSLADIYRSAEDLASSRQQRKLRDYQLEQSRAKAAREAGSRTALSDLILADGDTWNPQAPALSSLASSETFKAQGPGGKVTERPVPPSSRGVSLA